MAVEDKPLSALVAQGWEVVSFSATIDASGGAGYTVLLRRQRQHKILTVRKSYWGKGLVTKELDV